MNPAVETIKETSEKCALFIIEDDQTISENYIRTVNSFDSVKRIFSEIQSFTGLEELKMAYNHPNSNFIFIVDFQLHMSNAEKGKEIGRNVLNMLISMGDNPIYIITAYDKEVEAYKKYPQIKVIPKKASLKPDFEVILSETESYLEMLRNNSCGVFVESCVDPMGFDLLSEKDSSVNKVFEDYYKENRAYEQGKYFLAKCFLVTPYPYALNQKYSWITKDLSWVVSTKMARDIDITDQDCIVIKKYNREFRIKSILVGKSKKEIGFYGLNSLSEIVKDLNRKEFSELENLIIDHFILFRIADLYLDGIITSHNAVSMIRTNLSGEKLNLYEKIFIGYLWENEIRKCGYNTDLVDKELHEFEKFYFPKVADVFYCKVNEKPSDDSEYFSVEIKSADNPSETFVREYIKKGFPEYFSTFLKTFKLTYLYTPANEDPSVFFPCRMEEILPEEFNYLNE